MDSSYGVSAGGVAGADVAGWGSASIDPPGHGRTTSVYDGFNRLLKSDSLSGITTYSYDPAGNRTGLEDPSGDLTTYTWNAENHLVQTELPSGEIITTVWDPINKNAEERIVRRDDGTTVTNYLWDNNNILRETDDVGAVEAEYTYIPQPYGDLVSQRREAESHFYQFDALGSTTGLTDESGAVTDEYRYKAFGETVAQTGSTENPNQWVGQVGYRKDEATGDYCLRERILPPRTGQFLSADPLGLDAGDSNFYRYVGNDPVRVTDPSGLEPPIDPNAKPSGGQSTIQCHRPSSSGFTLEQCDLTKLATSAQRASREAQRLDPAAYDAYREACKLFGGNVCDLSKDDGQFLFQLIRSFDEEQRRDFIKYIQDLIAYAEEAYEEEQRRQSIPSMRAMTDNECDALQMRLDFEKRWEWADQTNPEIAAKMEYDWAVRTGNTAAASEFYWQEVRGLIQSFLEARAGGMRGCRPASLAQPKRKRTSLSGLGWWGLGRANCGCPVPSRTRRSRPQPDIPKSLQRGSEDALNTGFHLGSHGDFPSPRPEDTQSHHGVMSAWMKAHYSNYDKNQAPAILMPKVNHERTFGVYNIWRAKMTQRMGGTFDWKKVSEADIRALSEKMFEAAGVPKKMRSDYWGLFECMKRTLSQ